jgi:hypothetical protein
VSWLERPFICYLHTDSALRVGPAPQTQVSSSTKTFVRSLVYSSEDFSTSRTQTSKVREVAKEACKTKVSRKTSPCDLEYQVQRTCPMQALRKEKGWLLQREFKAAKTSQSTEHTTMLHHGTQKSPKVTEHDGTPLLKKT